ncbi:MAG: AMP-binding protein, partial [Alphaproteobacteria bacterium]|nr:AMP-binding protein [Alphaproteobacteria bacterium]
MSATTIPAVLARAARDRGDDPAIVDGDARLGCAALADAVTAAARALAALGVGPGDAVAIWAPNSWRWIVAALATHARGAVLVPINTRYKGDEAAFVLARSRARVLFTVDGFLGARYVAMLRATEAAPRLDATVILGGDVPAGATAWADFVAGGA